MPFSPGDQVHVASIGSGIVRETRRGGRYVIDVKGGSLVVTEAQLSQVEPRKRRGKRPDRSTSAPPDRAIGHAPSSLDLHGMTSMDAVAALDAFVNDAILAGQSEVRVIHGRSGGRLKAAIHARLRTLSSVRHFGVDPANPGVTIVVL